MDDNNEGFGFNPSEEKPCQPGEMQVLPEGDYVATLTKCERKNLKSGNGWGVNLTFEVAKGDSAGSKLFCFLSVGHSSSPVAQKLARGSVAMLCEVAGRPGAQAPQLYGIPVGLSVKCTKGDDGKIRNEIAKFLKAGDVKAGSIKASTGNAGSAAPGSGSRPADEPF